MYQGRYQTGTVRVSVLRPLLALLLLLTAVSAAFAAGAEGEPRYAPGEILIKYHEGAETERLHTATKARAVGSIGRGRWERLRLPPSMEVMEAVEHYRQQPEVQYAEPNYIARKAKSPDDPQFLDGTQWALNTLNATRAWDETTGSETVVVAVLDTGIAYNHPELTANLWRNPDETENGQDDDGNEIADDLYGAKFQDGIITGDPMDDDTRDWHGTHVSGIIGAVGNNGNGIAGLNWRISLMGVKALHGPEGEGWTSDIVDGIDYAIDKEAHLLNMSLEIGGYSTALEEALKRADEAGLLSISAAGNSGTSNDFSPTSPAAIRTPNNLAVAAITKEERLASYSNYGRLSVDLAAPGGERCSQYVGEVCIDAATIYSTASTVSGGAEAYLRLAGTSQAAPHVTGVAALVMARNSALTHHQVRARLLANVRPLSALDEITLAGGVLEAYEAVKLQEEPPSVFRVIPSSACLNEELVITGANFGSVQGDIYVEGVATPLLPTAWSPGGGAGGSDEVRMRMDAALPLDQYHRLRINDPASGGGFFVRRTNCKPVVSLTVDPAQGSAPLAVELRAEAEDEDGGIVRYEWDLGSGAFTEESTTSVLTHTFDKGGSYNLRVRVTDNDGAVVASDPLTLEVEERTSSSDSRCFIATAAWGSPLEREVVLLRRFRDAYLLNNPPGRAVVRLYYSTSPPLADMIRERPWARSAVRTLLTPLVAMANWLLSDAQASSSTPTPAENALDVVPGEYLIGFVSETREETARQVVEAAGGQLRRYRPASHYGVARFDINIPPEEVIETLKQSTAVRYVEPNYTASKP